MRCTYCAVGGGTLRYRTRSRERVLQEIETAVFQYQARFIDFEDENLSLDRESFLSLLREITRRFDGLGLELRAMNGLFTPSLDEAVIRAMKRAGFRTLNLSLGTSDPAQLRRFRRPDVREATDRAIQAARRHGLDVVCYIIAGAPDQTPRDSLADLCYLARRDVLAGVSIYYPAPGSSDYAVLEKRGMLPPRFSLMRSTALPISHATPRRAAATLLRLARILGFIRATLCRGAALPPPAPLDESGIDPRSGREAIGRRLLSAYFHDGRIRGMTPTGEIFELSASRDLSVRFRDALQQYFPIPKMHD
jgi:radical SAM superfamily enzyme YgiQ (UPF0313 family)